MKLLNFALSRLAGRWKRFQLAIKQKPYSYHQILELSEKKFWDVPSKNFGMIFWKLHVPENIGLRSMIHKSNEKWNNLELADKVSVEIYFEKM